MAHEKRLIEDSLPLEAISKQSASGKRTSTLAMGISTLCIDGGRAVPPAAMRAAIFRQLDSGAENRRRARIPA